MCGIAGYTHLNRRADRGLIHAITGLLKHRGPDQQGVHVSNDVSLGAVRLKIIDLDGGNQPMLSQDGQTILVFNGEIYNYRELREILRARGHQFQSQSDTEVVLRAFLEWDTGCLARLKGMFALALWQEPQQRLVLARDRMGIKPLYYAQRASQIYFGSELKALFAHPDISRTLDLVSLNQYLSLNYVPSPRCLIEGILKLEPGHFLEWSAGEVTLDAFWTLQFQPEKVSEEEASEQLDGLLRQSIREHLVSDVPLGVWLSGGVDSSTIVHYAATESSQRLKTFSVSFKGRSFDESRYFRTIAEHYSTDHQEFDLSRDQSDLEDTIRRFADYADEPCGDSSSLPIWYLSKLSREDVTVTLSGEGADELFGGYLTFQADRMARAAQAVSAPVRRCALALAHRWLPVSEDKISREYMAKRFLEGTFLSPFEAHCYWNGAFSEPQKKELLTFELDPAWGVEALADRGRGLGKLNRFLWFDQRYYLADDILAKVDRMSMAHSLEVRPPFLDHKIVEFAARLPEHLKIRGRSQKYLLKRLMQDKLPTAIISRKKVGFDIPAHDWLRRELKPLLLEVVSPSAVAQTGLFRPEVLARWVSGHFERRLNIGFHLWGLLILFLWMRKWKIQSPLQEFSEPAQPVMIQAGLPTL